MSKNGKKAAVIGGLVTVIALLIGGPLVIPMSNKHRMWIFRLQGMIAAEITLAFVSLYVWKSIIPLIDRTKASGLVWTNLPLRTLLVIFLVSTHGSLVTIALRSGYWICVYCFGCLGLYIQYVTCYFVANRLIQFWRSVKKATAHQPHQFHLQAENKRSSFATVYIAAIYAVSISTYGLYNASLPPVVKRVDIIVPDFPSSMNGFNIVLLSDIHFGRTVRKAHVERVVNIVNSLNPDLLAIVGDLADETADQSKDGIEPLKQLHSRHGKYFVSGNHEYYTGDVENWFKLLEAQLGFIVLHNSHVIIKNDANDFFYLAGTDDYEARRISYGDHGMDLEKAVGKCDKKMPIILLAHQPRAAKEALDSDYNIKLVLSGHTHGGQMMPMTVLAFFINPFFAGLYSYKSGQVYVTEGTVFWGIPMRMFSQSEVTNIYLHRA